MDQEFWKSTVAKQKKRPLSKWYVSRRFGAMWLQGWDPFRHVEVCDRIIFFHAAQGQNGIDKSNYIVNCEHGRYVLWGQAPDQYWDLDNLVERPDYLPAYRVNPLHYLNGLIRKGWRRVRQTSALPGSLGMISSR